MSEGFFTPHAVATRYNFAQMPVAANLLTIYREQHTGSNQLIVNVPELLARLGKPNDAFWRAELERVLVSLYDEQKIGWRIEAGTLSLWLPPEVAARARQYLQEEPV